MTAESSLFEVGERVAFWHKLLYPDHRAKRMARDYDVSVPTAERWLAGALPPQKHFTRMVKRFGERFTQFVYEPVWRSPEELAAERADIAARLRILEATRDDPFAACEEVVVATCAAESEGPGGVAQRQEQLAPDEGRVLAPDQDRSAP